MRGKHLYRQLSAQRSNIENLRRNAAVASALNKSADQDLSSSEESSESDRDDDDEVLDAPVVDQGDAHAAGDPPDIEDIEAEAEEVDMAKFPAQLPKKAKCLRLSFDPSNP